MVIFFLKMLAYIIFESRNCFQCSTSNSAFYPILNIIILNINQSKLIYEYFKKKKSDLETNIMGMTENQEIQSISKLKPSSPALKLAEREL